MVSTADSWFDRWPERLSKVCESIEARGWQIDDLRRDREAETATLVVSGLPHPLTRLTVVIGPEGPSVTPTVFSDLPLPLHWHPRTKNLCLPPDGTDPVTAIDDAIRLYTEFRRGGVEALRALSDWGAEPRSDYVQGSLNHSVLVPHSRWPDGDWGTFRLRAKSYPGSLHGWVDQISIGPAPWRGRSSTREAPEPTRTNLISTWGTCQTIDGVWFRTDQRDFPLNGPHLLQHWHQAAPAEAAIVAEQILGARAYPTSLGGSATPQVRLRAIVVPVEGPQPGEFYERVIVLAERPDSVVPIVADPLHVSQPRVPGLERLPDRTVAIAGLGMLGGPLPVWLARSGVGEIRLLDADTVEAGNLTRQSFTSTEIGQTKVAVARRHVQDAAPWSQVPSVHALYDNVRGTRRSTLISWLEGVDLLVLAMADWRANLRLADVAADLGIPLVTGWVTYGAWAGVAYRTIWGQSGCPQCLELDPLGIDPLPQAPGSQPGLFIEGCGQPTFPGNLPDGSLVTSLLGQLAIDALRHESPSRRPMAIATMTSSSLDSDPAIEWRSFPPHPDCPLCNRRR